MKKIILTALAAALVQGAFAADITVSAAASLTDAFGDIAKAYQAKYPDAKIDLNFAGSGALLQQISKGAPVDVFASADTVTMDKAADYIDPATRQNFVENRLVVIMPKDAKWDGKDLAALLDDKALKRIAIAHVENVPVGRYTKGALEKAGLWDKLGERNLPTQNVRQSLDYVARGEVDAGFVYGTDTYVMKDKVKTAFEVPTRTPILYPLAITKDSAQPEEARRFQAFVLAPEGQEVLARFFFKKP